MKTKNKNRLIVNLILCLNNRDRWISWKNSIIWFIKNTSWIFLTMLNSYCCCSVAKSCPILCLFSCPVCRIIVTAVGGFNAPVTLMDGSTKQKSNKNREWYSGPIRPNWYLQSIPHQNNGFHLFLKCTWIILKARTHPGPQI